MVVIAAYAKPVGRILENFSLVGIRTHWVVALHIADGAVSRAAIAMRADKVRTVIIVIFPIIFENTGILKHAWGVNQFCLAVNADHICAQLCNPGCFRVDLLAIRHAAAKIDICAAIVIHKDCWVKAPNHILAPWRLPCDQCLPNRILPRPQRRVGFQHANARRIIGKVQEEFVLALNLLVGNGRSPGMGCPFGCAVLPCYLDLPMVCPVHHIIGRNHPQAADIAIVILNNFPICVILIIICCHVDIYPPIIYDGIRVCAKFLGHQWVPIA